jgi:hypothetical protein
VVIHSRVDFFENIATGRGLFVGFGLVWVTESIYGDDAAESSRAASKILSTREGLARPPLSRRQAPTKKPLSLVFPARYCSS